MTTAIKTTNEQPFGWDITLLVTISNQVSEKTYHYRNCTLAKAKWKAHRRAIMTRHCSHAEFCTATPLDYATWVRAYGDGKM